MLIMFANAKGGAGKSTAAIGIAGEFAKRGYDVRCLDADTEKNLSRWYDGSKANDLMPSNISMATANLTNIRSIIESKKTDEVMILDTPGRDIAVVESALPYVDCIISPIQPSYPDLSGSSVIYAKRHALPKESQPAMLLVISNRTLTDMYSDTWPLMADYSTKTGLPIAETQIWARSCMKEVYAGAGTIQEYEKVNKRGKLELTDGIKKSRLEFNSLTDELIQLVAKQNEATA